MWTTGNQMGSVLTYPMGMLFCGMHDFLGGWPLIFYVPGEKMLWWWKRMMNSLLTAIVGAIWLLLFGATVTSSPLDNRFVGEKEKRFLSMEAVRYQFESKKVSRAVYLQRAKFCFHRDVRLL